MKTETYKKYKRAFDIAASSAGLIIAAPILIAASVAIKLESKGPLVYRSNRVGQDYKIFGLLKFRSMFTNADKQTDLMKQLNQYENSSSVSTDVEECPLCKILHSGHSSKSVATVELFSY